MMTMISVMMVTDTDDNDHDGNDENVSEDNDDDVNNNNNIGINDKPTKTLYVGSFIAALVLKCSSYPIVNVFSKNALVLYFNDALKVNLDLDKCLASISPQCFLIH